MINTDARQWVVTDTTKTTSVYSLRPANVALFIINAMTTGVHWGKLVFQVTIMIIAYYCWYTSTIIIL